MSIEHALVAGLWVAMIVDLIMLGAGRFDLQENIIRAAAPANSRDDEFLRALAAQWGRI